MEIILIVGLTSFAITYLLRYTDGPFGIFYYMRDISGFKRYADGTENAGNWFAEMIECYPCFTTWITIIVAAIASKLNFLDTVSILFASIGVSIIIWKLTVRT